MLVLEVVPNDDEVVVEEFEVLLKLLPKLDGGGGVEEAKTLPPLPLPPPNIMLVLLLLLLLFLFVVFKDEEERDEDLFSFCVCVCVCDRGIFAVCR